MRFLVASPLRILTVLVTVCVLAAVTAGCGTGDDAVAQGDTFQFVSPGGKTEIFYNPPAARKKVANLSGPDLLSGKTISLNDNDMAGKIVVINVWGSWCGPCRVESDDLERVYESTKASGVAFLGINFRDDRSQAQDFVRDRQVGYPSIYDYGGKTFVALTTPASVVPTTIILDRRHRAAAVYLRSVTADDLTAEIARLVAEPDQRS